MSSLWISCVLLSSVGEGGSTGRVLGLNWGSELDLGLGHFTEVPWEPNRTHRDTAPPPANTGSLVRWSKLICLKLQRVKSFSSSLPRSKWLKRANARIAPSIVIPACVGKLPQAGGEAKNLLCKGLVPQSYFQSDFRAAEVMCKGKQQWPTCSWPIQRGVRGL